ncbi:hypothetical protein Q5752_000004 [Cryptotrichosporon argae]
MSYAFTSRNAAVSSANRTEPIYTPLPNPSSTAAGTDTPSPAPSTTPTLSRGPDISTNPLSRGSVSPRVPYRDDPERSMPPQHRSRGPAAAALPRGDSQSALLASPGQRRYGPTASSAPIGSNTQLLSPNNHSPPSSLEHAPSDSSGNYAQKDGWALGTGLEPEADDFLHNPDPKRDRKNDRGGTIFTLRGLTNIGCLVVMILCLIALFAGYPIITYYTENTLSSNGAYNLGGINSSGQVPFISNFPTLIDADTDPQYYERTGFDGEKYTLVFSDEFNKDGRTFYDGDDPFWTAVDIHYWPTGDLEWYDPSAITTADGSLVITMTQETLHDLNFKSGMLQSWNQLCFQYSFYMEIAISLPGNHETAGFWPGAWTMGNLGRPGYGASTEGGWPYTYDSCDIGTLPNQTYVNGSGPTAALETGTDGLGLSYLPGQKYSACTCPGEDHPGPDTSKGRGIPEIDILEAQILVDEARGQVSQSAQIAPFDDYYAWGNSSAVATIYENANTVFNSYVGGVYQEAASALTYIDNDGYQLSGGGFNVYGAEVYADPNDRSAGYITWVANGQKSWQLQAEAVGPNANVGIGQRLISEEPMAMIINFGMSNNFQAVDLEHLQFPAHMLIDYVRIYQRENGVLGCDPTDHPTKQYINDHLNAYQNPNLTTWAAAGYTFPSDGPSPVNSRLY